MLSQSLAVFVVLALLFALLWVARRKGLAVIAWHLSGPRTPRAERQMRLVERLPLTGQHSLHLVECAGRLLVVAVSPHGCSTLADLAQPREQAISVSGGAR